MHEVSLSFLEVYHADPYCIPLVSHLHSVLVLSILYEDGCAVEGTLLVLRIGLLLGRCLSLVGLYIELLLLLPSLPHSRLLLP